MEDYKNNSGNSQSCDTVIKINPEKVMLSDNKEIANAFNKFYIQVAKNLNNELNQYLYSFIGIKKE